MLRSCYRNCAECIMGNIFRFLILRNLFHEPLGQWNNSKISETRKKFTNIVRGNVR